MTQKPRSSYTDHTRKLRSGRRTAILDAAAVRMGYSTWVNFSTQIRYTMEHSKTDNDLATDLRYILAKVITNVKDGPRNLPPADMQAVLAAYPPRKAGRSKIAKSSTD